MILKGLFSLHAKMWLKSRINFKFGLHEKFGRVAPLLLWVCISLPSLFLGEAGCHEAYLELLENLQPHCGLFGTAH